MIKEAFGFGVTVDEAKEDAMLALGASAEDEVQIEIIEMPKKKVLGVFGGSRAKVRVFIELPDEEVKPKKPKEKKKFEEKQIEKKQSKNESKQAQVKKEKPNSDETEYSEAVPADAIEPDSKAGKAVSYLKSVLSGLGFENTAIKVAQKENGALISLDGEGLGVVIGRRGETLEALQVLVSLAANKGGGYYRVSLNIGDYREKREQALVTLAGKVAKQVLSSGRNRALEPMSPFERRIIHTAIQEIDGVESVSVGEGENRRVVVHAEGKRVDADRAGRRPRGRGRDRRPSNTISATPSREPMKDSDLPLYGKIEK